MSAALNGEELAPRTPGKGRRLFCLSAGFIMGCVVTVAALWVIAVISTNLTAGSVILTTSGSEMSQSGAASLVVVRRSGRVTQRCNGVCDDLRVENLGNGNGLSEVRVLAPAGACLACVERHWPVFTGRLDDWRIEGVPRVRITRTGRGSDRG